MNETASLDAYLYYRHEREPETAARVRPRGGRAPSTITLRRLRKLACRALTRVR